MERCILRIECLAGGDYTDLAGKYIVAYDPNAHKPNGSYDGGELVVTTDRREARRFTDAADAIEYWRQTAQCACHALREDGRPNKPLTAYTVSLEGAPEE